MVSSGHRGEDGEIAWGETVQARSSYSAVPVLLRPGARYKRASRQGALAPYPQCDKGKRTENRTRRRRIDLNLGSYNLFDGWHIAGGVLVRGALLLLDWRRPGC